MADSLVNGWDSVDGLYPSLAIAKAPCCKHVLQYYPKYCGRKSFWIRVIEGSLKRNPFHCHFVNFLSVVMGITSRNWWKKLDNVLWSLFFTLYSFRFLFIPLWYLWRGFGSVCTNTVRKVCSCTGPLESWGSVLLDSWADHVNSEMCVFWLTVLFQPRTF